MGTDYSARETFVAAFANANAGDVSGNVDFGAIPDGIHDKSHMEEHGRKQFEAAGILFNLAGEELEGSLDHRHTRVDMAQVQLTDGSGSRTFPAGLGLSFAAGSTEDSIPRIKVGRSTRNSFKLKEGIRDDNMSPSERTDQAAIISGLAATFGITQNSAEFVSGHLPKPLILAPGLLNPPITPNVLPLQLIKVGNLLITAVPGEITTMAGRRLRETLLLEFQSAGIEHLALAAYANAYSQYITTKEEYDAQHYEGASTLFGPHTLAAYQQEFLKLAQSLQSNIQSAPGPNPSPPSAKTIRRVTFRNLSNKTIKLEIYDQIIFQFAMDLAISKLSELDLAPGTDLACIVPGHISEIKARIDGGDVVENIQTHQLVTIPQNGSAIATTYVPPDLPLKNKSTLGRNAPSKVLHPVLNIMMN
jgi:neutral ceramidase